MCEIVVAVSFHGISGAGRGQELESSLSRGNQLKACWDCDAARTRSVKLFQLFYSNLGYVAPRATKPTQPLPLGIDSEVAKPMIYSCFLVPWHAL